MKKKTRKIRWTDLALLPFAICVLFLIALGKLCGLTYKQIMLIKIKELSLQETTTSSMTMAFLLE